VHTPARSAKLADNVFSGAVNGQNHASCQSLGLAGSGRLKKASVAAEPDFDDAVAAHVAVHAASNRLNFRKFRHPLIVKRPVFRLAACFMRRPED
jgi:hypothetical protein